MKRLDRQKCESVRGKFSTHPLFLVVDRRLIKFQRKAAGVRLMPEEMFVGVADIIDSLLDASDEEMQGELCAALPDRIYGELQASSPNASDGEICLCTAVVVLMAAMTLYQAGEARYFTLCDKLVYALRRVYDDLPSLYRQMALTDDDLCTMKEWMGGYVNADAYLTRQNGEPDLDDAEGLVLPPELDGERAIALLKRCTHEGWLTEAFQPNGLTNGKKSVLANILSERLRINDKWRVFGDFWSVKPETLRQEQYEKSDTTKAFERDVKKIFPQKR